jgi:hypothetical protein
MALESADGVPGSEQHVLAGRLDAPGEAFFRASLYGIPGCSGQVGRHRSLPWDEQMPEVSDGFRPGITAVRLGGQRPDRHPGELGLQALEAGGGVRSPGAVGIVAELRASGVARSVPETWRSDPPRDGHPYADALIAATAIEHRLSLYTRNRSDFENVRGLRIREIG